MPAGEETPLIWVQDWNFNWQDQYVYREPIRLPKGTTIHVEGVYDNSAENPRNPSTPPQRVMFGEESNNEMCLAMFQAVADRPQDQRAIQNSILANAMRQLQAPEVTPELRTYLLRIIGQQLSGTGDGG